METQTAITLLTIIVSLLSGIMIVLLAIVIAILLKLRKLANNVDAVLQNVAQASEWLVPAKAINQIVNLFRK
jgi:hypothetical protein